MAPQPTESVASVLECTLFPRRRPHSCVTSIRSSGTGAAPISRPGSGPGCTIFVKLWQFDPEDRTQVRLDLFDPAPEAVPERPGVEMRTIFQDSRECVSSAFWHPGASIFRRNEGGMELLCLKGSFTEGGETFSTWSWLRLPPGTALQAEAGPEGAFLWMKEGHLRFVEKELAALEAAAP